MGLQMVANFHQKVKGGVLDGDLRRDWNTLSLMCGGPSIIGTRSRMSRVSINPRKRQYGAPVFFIMGADSFLWVLFLLVGGWGFGFREMCIFFSFAPSLFF